jgi:para-aminobenzoate synthetase component 1
LLVKTIPWIEPIEAFESFATNPVVAFLHSDGTKDLGRWSYIAASPFSVLKSNALFQSELNNQRINQNPFDILSKLLTQFETVRQIVLPPFQGGAVGFFSYELSSWLEELPRNKLQEDYPLLCIGLYDVVAAFDHLEKNVIIMSSGLPELDGKKRFLRQEKRAEWIIQELNRNIKSPTQLFHAKWTPDKSRQWVEDSIEKAISYINKGDIFQANITQRFTANKPIDQHAWEIFKKLRRHLSSPFGAYISAGDSFQILSASPERFIKIDHNGIIETRPIKGTRPRSDDKEEDDALANELAKSLKDRAENLMIVDLMRNDLSRVCIPGSVKVPQLCKLETFAKVHHLVSVIKGKLAKDKHAIDALRACFPGGSVTGAPKIRAMEIISELEPEARGPYCGAAAWIGFNGMMDSSILIRSLVVNNNKVIAQAGGGIVSDSLPALEFDESMLKISPLLSVLEKEVLK